MRFLIFSSSDNNFHIIHSSLNDHLLDNCHARPLTASRQWLAMEIKAGMFVNGGRRDETSHGRKAQSSEGQQSIKIHTPTFAKLAKSSATKKHGGSRVSLSSCD